MRGDKTQVVSAKIKGNNKKLQVKEMTEIESYLQYFEKFLEKPEEAKIQAVLEKLKTKIKFGNEDVYLVMPDEMFEMTDAANITNEAELKQFVEDSTGLNFEDLYVSTAIEATPGTNNKKTVYAMQKALVDAIARTADALNIQVVSIEAASINASDDEKRKYFFILTTWRNF